jgi:hypothetical protein
MNRNSLRAVCSFYWKSSIINPGFAMGFIKEFKGIVRRGNEVDLAMGMVIGGAFVRIIPSLVRHVSLPLPVS